MSGAIRSSLFLLSAGFNGARASLPAMFAKANNTF
jgi:hypothetical protein